MKRILRKIIGAILIIVALPLLKQFYVFPIGLYTTVKLIVADDGQGNVGNLLGHLAGDFIALCICIALLYFGVRLLKSKKIQGGV